ncbi:MAG: hypothetical protein GY755_13690 [Chloroflexi bacterium]|nr:hypothetical protein [Chloroflexota bacterium]
MELHEPSGPNPPPTSNLTHYPSTGARMRNKATELKNLYGQVTKFQTNENTKEILLLKKILKLMNKILVLYQNIIYHHGYHRLIIIIMVGIIIVQYKPKTFKLFYPNTAGWDRILRGCYELDCNDEEYIMDCKNIG